MSLTVLPSFPGLLKLFRTEKGISLAELGRRTGLSHSYLYRLEKGDRYPSRETVAKLAKALELSEEERKKLFWRAGFWHEEETGW